ncbi:hypothetical protein SBADM41S_02381 [Streptomyces badius]
MGQQPRQPVQLDLRGIEAVRVGDGFPRSHRDDLGRSDRSGLRAQQQAEEGEVRPLGPGLLGELPPPIGRPGIQPAHVRPTFLPVLFPPWPRPP